MITGLLSVVGEPGFPQIPNSHHPGVHINFERSEGQGYSEKLLASLAGGSGWDLFRIGGTQIKQYGSRNAIADITDLIEGDTIYPVITQYGCAD